MRRRDFLHNLSHLGAASLFASDLAFGSNLYNSNSYLSNTLSSGKVLVLVKLNGGNDGLNTVVPLNQMSNLNTARPHVILPDNKIINLGEKDLGLHPELSGFKSLFDEKRLKIIQNVGYETPNFSHFRSTDIWESASDYDKTILSGWLGRYLESQHPLYPKEYPNNQYPDPLSVELGVPSLLLLGKSFTSFVASNPQNFEEIISDFDNIYDTSSKRGTKLDYLQLVRKQANSYGRRIKETYESGVCKFEFNQSNLGWQFEKVTKLISGGLNTRIYLVELGGFDTHDTQVDQSDHTKGAHSILMKTLNDAVLTFMQNMDDIGRSDDLLVMTYSEFGRTIVSNGSMGTDHGTAAPLFVFGNKVDSTILGNNPVIPSNAEWQNNLATEFDFRQVYSSIMNQWLTVNPTTEEDVLFKKFDQLPIIQAKYVDTDGDGVSDDRDLCNNTPLGAMVNTDGCEIFSLPADNYTILTNGTSCSGKSNGKISISVANKQHIYNLSIPETEGSYSLNSDNEHQLEIDELEIGTYTLNFTVEGKEGYLQTFEIGITEPPSLSAKSSVNQKGKTMTVNLTGSDLYYTEVNGERTSYQINTFTLQLRPGMNTVRIYTPQDCQGEYVEQVFISEQVRHYPNPVKSDLNLVIPGEDSNTTVSLYSRSGSLVAKFEETIPFSRIVTINASQLPSDIYVIKVNGQTVDQTFKIIKR